jgi:hypothetical protein
MDATSNLLLEHLKRFQATLERVESKVDEHTVRFGRLEVALSVQRSEFADLDGAEADAPLLRGR